MGASIIIEGVKGQLKGKKWVFEEKHLITIGRYPDSDIVIPADETNISRLQCQIRITDRGVTIVDKDGKSTSPAGTWIDNCKIPGGEEGVMLETGHLLGMGKAGNTELFQLQIERSEEQLVTEPVKTVGVQKSEPELENEPHSVNETKNNLENMKAHVSSLEDAYEFLEVVFTEDESDYALRIVKQNYKWLEDWESLKNSPGLEKAYEMLSIVLSQKEDADEEVQAEEPERIVQQIDSSSFLINFDDYEIVDIKPNLVFDDKVVKDEEENAIDHQVKLASIIVGGLKGEYKMVGNKIRGGFGSTVRVQNKKTKQMFILKELLSSIRDAQTVKWFKREVLIGQQLDHPNVVKVFEGDFNEKERKYRYLMEYCAGGDLQTYMDKLLAKGKTMGVNDAVQIMYQILDGLDYLHNVKVICFDGKGEAKKVKGLVHRDIKPKNIFLMEKEDISHVKIGDYGTLKSVELSGESFQTRDKVVIVSDGYTPAKQLNQRENGFRYAKPPVDVFASAAIFYFLLTGKQIKRRRNADGEVEIIPILEINQKIPAELAAVIDNVLLEDNILDDDMVTSAVQFKNNIKKAMENI